MKNLTLRIDEKVLAAARKQAAMQGTTVAKEVREYLRNYAAPHLPETAAARQELVELAEQWRSPLRRLNRDEIYGERVGRHLRPTATGFAEPPSPHEDQAMFESAIGSPTLEEMTTDTGAPPEPGHDAWFRREVQKTLDRKKAGTLKYSDFREVVARFGLDAR